MRHQLLLTTVCLSLMAGLSGCIVPATLPEAPALSGRVVTPSGEPAGGATVVITQEGSWRGPDFRKTIVAGEDGRFARDEQVRWFLWLVPGETMPTPLQVHAEHQGLKSSARRVMVPGGAHILGLGKDKAVDLGNIELLSP